MPITRALSRLELAVLGLVSGGAPCTAYWIQQQFQGSPSSHFSGSAGAVYPAVRRLEAAGLLRVVDEAEAGRGSSRYELTPDGMEGLRSWLLPPLPDEDIAFSVDPIRTRVYYLEALTADERRRFIEDALVRTRRHVRVIEADCESKRADGAVVAHLGARGALLELRARIRWLEEVRAEIGSES